MQPIQETTDATRFRARAQSLDEWLERSGQLVRETTEAADARQEARRHEIEGLRQETR